MPMNLCAILGLSKTFEQKSHADINSRGLSFSRITRSSCTCPEGTISLVVVQRMQPSMYQVLLHAEMLWNGEITLFQHMPCRYLPVSLIDRHPIWPPQPVHSHRLVRAIARQISSANISNGPKTFDFCPDGSPDIYWLFGWVPPINLVSSIY